MKKICLALSFGLFFNVLSVNAQIPTGTPNRAEEIKRMAREREAANQEAAKLKRGGRD